jgi:hypothetical protein
MHDKCFLKRVEFSVLGQPFDSNHLFTFNFFDSCLAGQNGLLVYKNRTGSAVLFSAAIFGACEAKIGAQNPQEDPISIETPERNRSPLEAPLSNPSGGVLS